MLHVGPFLPCVVDPKFCPATSPCSLCLQSQSSTTAALNCSLLFHLSTAHIIPNLKFSTTVWTCELRWFCCPVRVYLISSWQSSIASDHPTVAAAPPHGHLLRAGLLNRRLPLLLSEPFPHAGGTDGPRRGSPPPGLAGRPGEQPLRPALRCGTRPRARAGAAGAAGSLSWPCGGTAGGDNAAKIKATTCVCISVYFLFFPRRNSYFPLIPRFLSFVSPKPYIFFPCINSA